MSEGNDQTGAEAEIIALVARHFGIDPATLDRRTVAADVEGWDSMAHAEIILSIEDEFEIEFEPAEIVRFEDLGSIIDAVVRHKRSPVGEPARA